MQNANLHTFPTSQFTEDGNTRISEDVKAYILSQLSSLKSKFPNHFTDASVAILVFTTNSFSGMLVADPLSTQGKNQFVFFLTFLCKIFDSSLTKFFICVQYEYKDLCKRATSYCFRFSFMLLGVRVFTFLL